MIDVVVVALAPIFLILFLGYWAGVAKLMDNKNVSLLTIFLMDFALPGALFLSTIQTPWSGILRQGPLILVLAFSMWVSYGLLYFLSRRIWRKEGEEAAVLSLTAALPNYAALGLPILNGVFGEGVETSLSVAVAISCGATLVTPICLMSLEAGKRATSGRAADSLLLPKLVAASFKKPIVFAPLAGVVLSFLLGLAGIKVPQVAVTAIKPLGAAALGTALFLTGLILSGRTGRLSVPVILVAVVKNLLMPFLAWFFAIILGLDPHAARIAVLLIALSAGFFGVVFGVRYGIRSPDAEGALLASTIAFTATIPIFIVITG